MRKVIALVVAAMFGAMAAFIVAGAGIAGATEPPDDLVSVPCDQDGVECGDPDPGSSCTYNGQPGTVDDYGNCCVTVEPTTTTTSTVPETTTTTAPPETTTTTEAPTSTTAPPSTEPPSAAPTTEDDGPVPAPHQAVPVACDGTYVNIPSSSPLYNPDLDLDDDGVACETATPRPVTLAASTGARRELPRTGSTMGPLVMAGGGLLLIGGSILVIRRKLAA